MNVFRRNAEIGCWLLTGMFLAVCPKCPACLVAYVAIGTGIGLSISTAWYLRIGLMMLCGGSLALLTLRLARRSVCFLPGREPQLARVQNCECCTSLGK